MIPNQPLRARRIRVPYERPQPTPHTKHIPAAHLDIRGEVPPYLREDPADFFLFGARLARDGCGGVGGARDGVALPREEEDDAPVGGGGVEEAHFAWGVVVGERDVDSGGGLDDGRVGGVVEC